MKAIVTGGNRGIGLEISKQLLAKGYEVHVLSRSGLQAPIENMVSWHADMADFDATLNVINRIGAVQVLVNNAGIMNAKTATEYGPADIQNMLDINLITTVRLSIHVAQHMAANGGGRIVSLGSIAGEIGHPDIWYGISKAGVMNAMRSLARSFGPHGVIANSIAPGPVETEMMQNLPEDRKVRLKAATITQRFCTAEEAARTVVWLATDSPSSINGEVIDINNGSNFR